MTPMDKQTANQSYHLILADIAMAAAIRVYDRDNAVTPVESEYSPGLVRDSWLSRTADAQLRRQVTAMANAGMGSLQSMPAEELVLAARNYGVPLDMERAQHLSEHFAARRDAFMSYRR